MIAMPHFSDPQQTNRPIMISLVVPCHNEAETVACFHQAIVNLFDGLAGADFELLFVDDGSTDTTVTKLIDLCNGDARVKMIELSRNFGKEAAMTAGIDAASGDAVVPMDADLQDPPELIVAMLEKWRAGAQVVLARRVDRSSDSLIKRGTARWFYKIHNMFSSIKIPENVGDFRLMDRMVVDALKQLPEQQRFMKGLFAWLGFATETVDYVRNPRVAGESKFPLWRLWNFAIEGFTSFGFVPLKLWTYIGLMGVVLAVAYGGYIAILTLFGNRETPGFASLIMTIIFFGSVQLIGLGMLGEYIGRIYIESKRRPVYLVRRCYGLRGSAFAGRDDRGRTRQGMRHDDEKAAR